MSTKALEAARDALIEALNAVNAALASHEGPRDMDTRSVRVSTHMLRLSEVKQITGMSRSFIYNGIKNGTFPAPVSLGARAIGWGNHAIDQWIRAKLNK